jgi:hypothetical protein
MSLTQSDITNLNNAEGQTKSAVKAGYKLGIARCTFDATGGKATGAHVGDLTLPKGAVVKAAYYKVLTTFTSATDAATIAISVVAANDVVSAAAISTGTTWDAASIPIETVPKVETSTTWLVTTADSPVTFTVATEALTAGKMLVWFEYLYFGDVA